jgi:hypothetical protein
MNIKEFKKELLQCVETYDETVSSYEDDTGDFTNVPFQKWMEMFSNWCKGTVELEEWHPTPD